MFGSRKLIREKIGQTAVLAGREVAYTLIRSNRARRLSIKIGGTSGLEVIVPLRGDISRVPRFMREKEDWILRHVDDLAEKRAQRPQFEDGARVRVLGEEMVLRIFLGSGFSAGAGAGAGARKKKASAKEVRPLVFKGESAYFGTPEIHVRAASIPEAKKALEKHLRGVAERHFAKRTAQIASQMNTTFERITIKGQKSRWGSCSRQKNLNFNWRLVLAPPAVMDSIIMHELAHTVHMSHGVRFYALLGKHCPDHRRLSKMLQETAFII
ncbi:M48 family metallopeptidase [Patescibacteria group bacterium]|nr:M48 family metallopeptidase [Patescibacteria group bacterium]MBU1703431.1 M48 family metallopeptidase [Patescibacteria group bacterium]MBU1953630.1 M48 family metallopeptidase [Patescibacteria group bacterium]